MSNVHFKGYMEDSTQANWNAVMKVYEDGDPSLPIVSCECTCLFHWSTTLNHVTWWFIKV